MSPDSRRGPDAGAPSDQPVEAIGASVDPDDLAHDPWCDDPPQPPFLEDLPPATDELHDLDTADDEP